MSFVRGVLVGCLATAGVITIPKMLSGSGETEKVPVPVPVVEEEDPATPTREQQIHAFGRPKGGRITRTLANHVLEYDCGHKIPVWASQHLTASGLKGEADRKRSDFRSDPHIPAMFSAQNSDYKGSGWSRGHMSPAGDCKSSQVAMNETFYLTNILPQDYQNNGDFWNRMEIHCRDLTQTYDDVWVTSGPLFLPTTDENGKKTVTYRVIGENEVSVPTHLYKVIVAKKNDKLVAGSFVVPNKSISSKHQLKDYQVPLEQVEKKAGLIFHSNLDRSAVGDLCEESGCNMMTRLELDQYVYIRRLKRATNLQKLEKIWKEMKDKEIPTTEALTETYQKYQQKFSPAETCSTETAQVTKGCVDRDEIEAVAVG